MQDRDLRRRLEAYDVRDKIVESSSSKAPGESGSSEEVP